MQLITDLEYFPSIDYYKKTINYSYLLFELYVRPLKGGSHNRMRVASGSGPLLLSIPLEGGRDQRKLLKDVRIANRYPWQDRHFKTLASCYNRSPWFDHYRAELEELYRTPFVFLAEWDLACLSWAKKSLGLEQGIGATNDYIECYNPDSFSDVRDGREGAGKQQLRDRHVQRYPQVFEDRTGFIPNLSVLDLLFCLGPAAKDYLSHRDN